MPGPIFINSSFRTSSTWLWEKLRRLPRVTAYYEIFNPDIATLSAEAIRGGTYDSWDSKHPPGAPYFLEFLPLLAAEGGVPLYKNSMALRRFIPADGIDGTLSEDQQAYVRRLIDHAVDRGTVPVLTCTRTLGRVRALRKAFGGHSVLIYRNLFHQWGSYCYQAVVAGNGYFLSMLRQTIAKSQHDPFIKTLADWFPDQPKSGWGEDVFARFLLLHLYLYACAYDASDLVVDVNAVATDAVARADTEAALSAMVGAPVDLADARESFQYSPLVLDQPQAFVDTVEQFTRMIAGNDMLSPSALAFLSRIKDEALAELGRHEFFCREARAVHRRQLDDVRTFRHDVLVERLRDAEAECARLRALLAERETAE